MPLAIYIASTNCSQTAGYLGAGKSTLLNYILSAQHGKKIAVILNGLYFPIANIPFKV